MPASGHEHADIDAALARGEWWLRLFEELSHRGAGRRDALPESRGGLARGITRAVDRAARGLRLAVIAILRLEQILAGLAALRLRAAADIAAIRARAVARAKSHGRAEGRPTMFDDDYHDEYEYDEEDEADEEDVEDEEDDEDWDEWDAPDRETPDRAPRGSLVDALDRRLAAVDPVLVDFDDLGLRETVLRICADLGITPDWSRWEAGDWTAPDTPAHPVAPASRRPAGGQQEAGETPALRESARPPVLPGLPGSVPRPAATTPVGRFLAERDAERWRPRLE